MELDEKQGDEQDEEYDEEHEEKQIVHSTDRGTR